MFHEHEPQVAWAQAWVDTRWQRLYLGVGNANLMDFPELRVMALQQVFGSEAKLVDPSHDKDTPWIFTLEILQIAAQSLKCF
mmetsp:Transcript_104279/g.185358  ORF Transcript_104279/g.185358 Transcript_104279/m.185358 type:complete len:82 (+) Transcript_104279:1743-1988(+)